MTKQCPLCGASVEDRFISDYCVRCDKLAGEGQLEARGDLL